MVIHHILAHPLRLTLSTLKLACALHLCVTHLAQCAPSLGPSMVPTFAVDGDWLLADMTARRGRRLRVGDLALYRIPIFADQDGVKRVVGLPGDFVSLGTPGERGEDRMIQIPQGHCWVVGDNLPTSRDSRHFGPLPLALVQGKIVARVLPWRDRGWIPNGLQEASET